jgi:hypothetical protein
LAGVGYAALADHFRAAT